ncbi:MAG: beta-N-acetylhexosaminidase [Blastocatellia bacterium]
MADGIGQMFCVSLAGPELNGDERRMLSAVRPGCVLLFARNCQTAPQVRALTDELRGIAGHDVLIAIDQEGGRVDRLRAFLPPMPSAAETARGGLAAATQLGDIIGRALRLLGVNFNFAPVLDYAPPACAEARNGLETRLWAKEPREIAGLTRGFLAAMQQADVIGCLKHFPGLGRAAQDPHQSLPVTQVIMREWEKTDFHIYHELMRSGLPGAVMVSHAAYPDLEPAGVAPRPASMSPYVVEQLLREKLGFDGLAVTDDLSMGAAVEFAGSTSNAASQAIAAGLDLLLVCGQPDLVTETHAALAREKTIDAARLAASHGRISRVRQLTPPPPPFDNHALARQAERIIALRLALRRELHTN